MLQKVSVEAGEGERRVWSAVCSVSRVQSERSVGSVASVVATVAVGSTLAVSRSGM